MTRKICPCWVAIKVPEGTTQASWSGETSKVSCHTGCTQHTRCGHTGCAHWRNSGMMSMGINKGFLTEYESCFTEGFHVCCCKRMKSKWLRRLQDRGRESPLVSLPAHAVKLRSNIYVCTCRFFITLTLARHFFLQWVVVNTASYLAQVWSISNCEFTVNK